LGATTKGQENSEIGNSKEDFHLVGGIRYYEALPGVRASSFTILSGISENSPEGNLDAQTSH
jgi:hypothetical protein